MLGHRRTRFAARAFLRGVEVCEPRRCLTYNHVWDGAILSLNGRDDEAGDVDTLVSITVAGGVVKYTDDDGLQPTTIDPAAVMGINIHGNDGNDSIDLSGLGAILPNLAFILYQGDAGDDTIKLAPEAAFDIPPTIADGFSQAVGAAGKDTITGNTAQDVISGGEGNDTLFGGANNDKIDGGADRDWTFSNLNALAPDQRYGDEGPAGTFNMQGSGGAACDIEDGHLECPLESAIAGEIGYGGYLDIAAPGVLEHYTGLGWVAEWSSNGTYGTIDMHDDGSFRYSVLGAPPSTDTFEYIISDGENDSLPGTAELSLTNPAPVAVNDNYSTSGAGYGNVFNFGSVLTNDTWTPGEHKKRADGGYTQPGGGAGSIVMNQDGSFTFTRTHNWIGQTTFTYYAHDFVQASASPATVTITLTNPLMFAGEEAENPVSTAVTQAQADAALLAAGQSWINAGLTQEALDDVLAGVSIVITDLPGAQLAGAADGAIYLDPNAAGYGWYTGIDYDETAAAGSVDLLTAMRHEIAHLLGLEHSEEEEHGGLMDHELGLGTRRDVSAADAAIAQWLWEQEE